MASYAAAQAELDRISGLLGVCARRDPDTLTGSGSAQGDNRIEVKDGRNEVQRIPDSEMIASTPNSTDPGRYGWCTFDTTAGDAGTYWSSTDHVN